MIQPNYIDKVQHGAKPVCPPAVIVARESVPCIEGIAPELSGCAEVIRRHARYGGWVARIVELKILGIYPDVHAVVRHINWQIAHNADSTFPAIGTQLPPL